MVSKSPEGKTHGLGTVQLPKAASKKPRTLGTIWKKQPRGLKLGGAHPQKTLLRERGKRRLLKSNEVVRFGSPRGVHVSRLSQCTGKA